MSETIVKAQQDDEENQNESDQKEEENTSQAATWIGETNKFYASKEMLLPGYNWGPWRVVMSNKLGKPFFYNTVTKIGQFAIPKELKMIPFDDEDEDEAIEIPNDFDNDNDSEFIEEEKFTSSKLNGKMI